MRPAVLPVALVDDDDDLEPLGERLSQDEARLGHGPVRGADEHERRVGHADDALDLSPEVGVAGRVDDVDPMALPLDGTGLREDRDSTLLLDVVAVHDELAHGLVVAEDPALLEKAVNERGLAVVDMGDDRHVTDLGDVVKHRGRKD